MGRGFGGESAGRRKYRKYYRNMGRTCEDCGWEKPLTEVFFWAGSGKQYWFCSTCIEPYRTIIMHPNPEWRR
jgi:hypothetical protein